MPKPKSIIQVTKYLFIFVGLLCVFSCNQNQLSDNTTVDVKNDSIEVWLNQANTKGILQKDKAVLLVKAYEKSSQISNIALRLKYLTRLSVRQITSQDTIVFKKINKEALQIAKMVKDSASLAELHWDLGAFYKNHMIPDSAYFHYAKSEKYFNAVGNQKQSGQLLIDMAGVQANIGDYTGAEITAIKALEKLKPLKAYRQLYFCYNELADLSKLLNENDRALEYYDEAFKYLKEAKMSALREQSYKNNIGLVYQKMGEHEKAIPYFTEVLSFDSLHFKNPKLCGRALSNLGTSYLKTNNTSQLPAMFVKAIAIQDSINDISGKTSSTHSLAEYYLHEKDTANAMVQLQLAKTYAVQSSDNKKSLQILHTFPRVDPKNAPQYIHEYVILSDKLLNQERRIRNKFARIRFETDEFIAENQLLAGQKQLWSGIATSLLLLGLAAFMLISQRNKNKILKFRQQQQVSNQEIFNLLLAQNEKMEEGKKLEQKRVSEELHDGVLGKMLGARMMLIGLNKKTDSVAVSERARAISILQEVEGEVRSISHELSHAAYQKIHNFILSIQDLLETVERSSKINIDFNFADDLDWDALSGDVKINLYRMIQESIQNAVKHSECRNIYLNFETDAEFLRITVIDNGKGFIVKKGKKGKKSIGIRNIASRMQKVNGTWDIDSIIGKGTTVTLIIPIVANDGSTNIRFTKENLHQF